MKIGFTFLDRQRELVIFMLTDYSADIIRGNIIYTTLGINTRVGKDFIVKANILWL